MQWLLKLSSKYICYSFSQFKTAADGTCQSLWIHGSGTCQWWNHVDHFGAAQKLLKPREEMRLS